MHESEYERLEKLNKKIELLESIDCNFDEWKVINQMIDRHNEKIDIMLNPIRDRVSKFVGEDCVQQMINKILDDHKGKYPPGNGSKLNCVVYFHNGSKYDNYLMLQHT
jgi:tetrahydromethanopterin S-methyltransferase subunit G